MNPIKFAEWIRDNTTADGAPLLLLYNKDQKRYTITELYEIATNYKLSNEIDDLIDFAFEVCPLHREDDLHKIIKEINHG